MIRAVLDTNVFVSAYLLPGRLNQIATLVRADAFRWLLSDGIFEEYVNVAVRPIFKIPPKELASILVQIKEHVEWVVVQSHISVIAQDPADDKFLACAVEGHAAWIVSGDRHLLALKTFRGIRIGPPAEFLRALGK